MFKPRWVVSLFSVAGSLLSAGIASGQTASTGAGHAYPYKPIRIVTGGAGGTTDLASRVIGQGLTARLGQQVIVDNRPNGVIAGDIVSRAPPDGYTLILYGSIVWLAPFMQDKVPYDPVRDLSPITSAISSPTVMVVHPSVPAKSVKELIALAKAKPGALNYASGPAGGSSHLAAELFNSMAGVNLVRITYKSNGDALNDLLGGRVQLMFSTTGALLPHIKSGKLIALAVTSAQPSELIPGLSTVAASGVPGYEAATTYGMFAPAATPAPLISQLNQEIVRILKAPDIQTKFHNVGADIVASSTQQFAMAVKSEMATMGKLIKDLGIRSE